MAERLSRLHPDVEIAVYAYDWWQYPTRVEEFYRAKDGRTAKEWLDRGLVAIMGCGYYDETDWVENLGYLLLHPMESAAEVIRRAREDEDTNMEVELLRYEDVEGSTFEKNQGEEERLIQMVMEQKDHLTIEELTKLCNEIDDNEELLLERINKGDEEAAYFINDPAILQELCDKGNKYAAFELYHKCMWGDEENGIFINKREAKHYFDLAGDIPQQYEEEWDDVDDPGEEYPEEFCYTLTGDAQTLDAVETLINDLCQQFGTPSNEMGLFVPQQMLMQLLVGSDSIYYRGNVLSMERKAPDTLEITTEADKGEPLLYALRECFENLEVEMKA